MVRCVAVVLLAALPARATVVPGRWEKMAAEKPGTRIIVTLAMGDLIECAFVGLEPDSLAVATFDGVQREYRKSDVVRIVTAGARTDSIADGAALGALVGALQGFILASASGGTAGGALAMAGFGAGIGLAADAASKGPVILYEAPRKIPGP